MRLEVACEFPGCPKPATVQIDGWTLLCQHPHPYIVHHDDKSAS